MSLHKMAIIILLITFSQAIATPFSGSVTVNTVSPTQTEISFTLPPFKLTEQVEKEQTFHKIEMEDAFASADEGLPNMPHFSATLAVPIGSEVAIGSVSLSEPRYISTLPIYPVQNYESNALPFYYEQSFYESTDPKASYPATSYFMTDVQTMRDYQYVVVKINPIRYIPSLQAIEIIDTFQFTITHLTDDPNPTYTTRPRISKAFERFYEHTLMNYDQVRSPNPAYQEPSILLIYGNPPSDGYANSMLIINNIINMKKQQGFYVHEASTTTAGTSTTAIKNYIQNRYNTDPNPPEWIILLGGPSGYTIPHHTNIEESDYQYTLLNGNDIIGDAFIGRIYVTSYNDLNNYWTKMQRYAWNSPAVEPTLYKKAMLVGSSGTSGVSTYLVNRYIKMLIQNYEPTSTFLEVYGQSVSTLSGFNQGHGQFNFRGYIGMNNFSYEYDNVTNTNVLSNMVLLTCGTGTYNNTSSTSAGFMRRMAPAGPAGAITATGMSSSGTKTEYNNAEAGGVFYALYVMDVPTMGEALLYGKYYLTTVYPGSSYTTNTIHWTNLMGDPSIYIHKTTPKSFTTPIHTPIPAGTQAMRLVVTDNNNDIVTDAWVTISSPTGSYVSKAISDEDGIAFIAIDTEQTGPFMLTISKPGFFPTRQPVMVSTTEQVVSVTECITYDPAPGNTNETINPGELINLTIKVKNFKETQATNLTATISSESQYVTFSGATTFTLGSIGAGLEALYDDAFTFTVSPLTPDKTLLPLTIVITDGSNTWISYLLPPVMGVDVKYVSMNPSYLNIGSNTNVTFTLKNEGNIPSGELQATLISRSIYLIGSHEVVTIPNLPTAGNVTLPLPFAVTVANFMIPGMKLRADLRLYNDSGYEVFVPLSLQAGTKVVTDPTGPNDEYNYVIYHSADSNEEERPEYNWINIRTIGQNTGITDISSSQEEDKATIMLPFTASFYGVEYDRITVCSNGWLVFGDTEQKNFRNLPLPGPLAPKAMIAPYWTDLLVGGSYGGGIYKYYHEQEQAYIIQFDKLRWITDYSGYSGFTASAPADTVSFQVLIYDPLYNGTGLGDSKIKIQYSRFHPGLQGPSDHPFNYITVGIQDHTYKRGIQYTYNGVYSPGSNTLSNGSALLITQPSFLMETPYLQLSQTYYHPENGGATIMAGEHCNIGVSLINVGNQPAENVSATITFNSPYIELIQGTSTFNDIASRETQSNLNYFTVFISSDIPNNTRITGRVIVTADGVDEPLQWTREINFVVVKPAMQYRSFMLNDSAPGGNSDGIVDPGETLKLIVNIANTTLLDITNMVATISSSNPLVNIINNTFEIAKMKANSNYQTVFEIAMDPSLQMIDNISIFFTATSQNTETINKEISLGINQSTSLFQEFFEVGNPYPSGWTFSNFANDWSRSQTTNAGGTLPEMCFAGAANQHGTSRMISPVINTTDISRALITFRQNLIVAQAGLGTTVGLASRRSNNDGWVVAWSHEVNDDIPPTLQTVDINNNTLGSTTFQFCFFITGNLAAVGQWYIDSTTVQNSIGNTATIQGRVTASHSHSNVVGLKVQAGDYSTVVLPDATYSLYLLPRSYPTVAVVDPYYTGNAYNNFSLEPGQIESEYHFNLHYMAPADTMWIHAIADTAEPDTKNITLKWYHYYNYETDPLRFTGFNIYGQINSTQYDLLDTITETDTSGEVPAIAYTTAINTGNMYRFYAIATYALGASEPCLPKLINPATMQEEPPPPTSDSDVIAVPIAFSLQQNYPNPFNPTTTIAFSIPQDSMVKVDVYNIKGQLVKNLAHERMTKGNHTLQWHGDNNFGQNVGTGIYFIRVSDGKHSAVRKGLLLK